jgi:polyferredoxin
MTLSRFRFYFQLASTFLTNSYLGVFFTRTINSNILKGVCVPYLNCYACPSALFSCPIGTLQHFMAIHTVPYYWLGIVGLVGLTTGRMACGWLCPFGFLQELLYKIKCKKIVVPIYLTYLKYVVLVVLVMLVPYLTGELAFSKLCPAGTLTAGIPWVLWNPTNPATGQLVLPDGPGVLFAVDLIILAGCLVWFVVSKRPFCRVICPMGAILSMFNRFSLIRLEVDRKCDGCNVCQVNCPTDLTVAMDVDSGDCIRCLECTRCGHVKIAKTLPQQNKGQRPCVKM